MNSDQGYTMHFDLYKIKGIDVFGIFKKHMEERCNALNIKYDIQLVDEHIMIGGDSDGNTFPYDQFESTMNGFIGKKGENENYFNYLFATNKGATKTNGFFKIPTFFNNKKKEENKKEEEENKKVEEPVTNNSIFGFMIGDKKEENKKVEEENKKVEEHVTNNSIFGFMIGDKKEENKKVEEENKEVEEENKKVEEENKKVEEENKEVEEENKKVEEPVTNNSIFGFMIGDKKEENKKEEEENKKVEEKNNIGLLELFFGKNKDQKDKKGLDDMTETDKVSKFIEKQNRIIQVTITIYYDQKNEKILPTIIGLPKRIFM
jgi:hypothetical protein